MHVSRRELFKYAAVGSAAAMGLAAVNSTAARADGLGTLVDYSGGVPSAAAIAAAGHLGAVRYVSDRRPGADWMIGKPLKESEADALAAAGLEVVAISTDDQEGLEKSLEAYEKGAFPFPLVANSSLDVFKAYRAYDDFEGLALHGTYLIDGKGAILWHDISYEPFMDPGFVLSEWLRLSGSRLPPSLEWRKKL